MFSALCAAVFAVATLSGCEPAAIPDAPGVADLTIAVGATGGAEISLMVAGNPTRARLLQWGRYLAGVLPEADAGDPEIDSNRGGSPFVTEDVARAYLPGRHATVQIDTGSAIQELAQAGVTVQDVQVFAPHVRTTTTWNTAPSFAANRSWSWSRLSPSNAPRGTLDLAPEPSHAWLQIDLLATTLIVLLVGVLLRTTRAWKISLASSGVAVITAATAFLTAGWVQMDNLGVTGALNDTALRYIQWLPVVTIAGGGAGVALIVATVLTNPPSGPTAAGAVTPSLPAA